jgi:hypothetical protein
MSSATRAASFPDISVFMTPSIQQLTLTLDIKAEAPAGFADGEVSVVRDNARQLKFKAESTGFED